MRHAKLGTTDGIHTVVAYIYANTSAREGATGFTSEDLGKIAWQTDNNSLWLLISVAPAWVQVTSGSGSATTLTIFVKKSTPGTIALGKCVFLAGYDAGTNTPLVELAKADSSSTMPCFGMSTAQITDSSGAYMLLVGPISGLNTSGVSTGASIYVSAATAGEFTSTPPTGPNLVQNIGVCVYSNASGQLSFSHGQVLPLSDSTPADVTKATASAGTSAEVSRVDHKHNVTTATAGAATPGDSAAEGTATSLARSDHQHSLPAFGSTGTTFCVGNDSRLSDDRTASGLRTATTVVVISAATAPTSGQVLTASSSTAASWGTPTGGGSLPVRSLAAADFDDPGTDWSVTSAAGLAVDGVNAAILVRRFDDTTEEGVGWTALIPATAVSVKFTIMSKAVTAPGATRTVGLALKKREIADNAALGSWSSYTLTDVSISADVYFHRSTQTISLSTLSLTADKIYQFELVRQNPTGGTELPGDWALALLVVEWL